MEGTLTNQLSSYICYYPNEHSVYPRIVMLICAFFYCPHMRNLLIMTDSSHFGDNARIVTNYLSPNARIGGRLLVSVFS